MWTIRKLWDAQRLLMIGPPCLAPVSSLVPAPPVYQVSSAEIQVTWDMRQYFIFNRLVYCLWDRLSSFYIRLFYTTFDSFILSCLQNLSPTTLANQTVACQRLHPLVMCALRVWSAPSSLRPGREAIRQMNPRWTLKNFVLNLYLLCFIPLLFLHHGVIVIS